MRRRLLLIQARVRSTIHGLGNTTDLCSSLRFTISRDPFAGGGSGRGSPLKEWKQGARAGVEHKRHTVAILNIGRMNCNTQQKSERIDEDAPLAAGDLLARIVTLRVPFLRRRGSALTVDDRRALASRLACSRTAS